MSELSGTVGGIGRDVEKFGRIKGGVRYVEALARGIVHDVLETLGGGNSEGQGHDRADSLGVAIVLVDVNAGWNVDRLGRLHSKIEAGRGGSERVGSGSVEGEVDVCAGIGLLRSHLWGGRLRSDRDGRAGYAGERTAACDGRNCRA